MYGQGKPTITCWLWQLLLATQANPKIVPVTRFWRPHMIRTHRDSLIEQFAQEIGAVRPEDVPAPTRRVTVRKPTNLGQPMSVVGKLNRLRASRAGLFVPSREADA
jgi:hypothetical protein